jgi:hypothetical protein
MVGDADLVDNGLTIENGIPGGGGVGGGGAANALNGLDGRVSQTLSY